VNADQEVQRRDDQEVQYSGSGYQMTADADNSAQQSALLVVSY